MAHIRQSRPDSVRDGTSKTVKAGFWPWLSDKSPETLLRCSRFSQKRAKKVGLEITSIIGNSPSFGPTPGVGPKLGLVPGVGPNLGLLPIIESFSRINFVLSAAASP